MKKKKKGIKVQEVSEVESSKVSIEEEPQTTQASKKNETADTSTKRSQASKLEAANLTSQSKRDLNDKLFAAKLSKMPAKRSSSNAKMKKIGDMEEDSGAIESRSIHSNRYPPQMSEKLNHRLQGMEMSIADESQGRDTACIQGQIQQTLEKAGGITTLDMEDSDHHEISGFQSQNEEDTSHYYHAINKQINLEEDRKSQRAMSYRKMSKENYPLKTLLSEIGESKPDRSNKARRKDRTPNEKTNRVTK